jgi:hypothetical protein
MLKPTKEQCDALARVLAMAEEMSHENSYAEVDFSDPNSGGVAIGIKPEVTRDLRAVKRMLARMRQAVKGAKG